MDFPAPLGPMTPTNWQGATLRETPERTERRKSISKLARFQSRASGTGGLLQKSAVEAQTVGTDPEKIPKDQFFGFEEPAIEERPAAAAQILHAPAGFRPTQDRMTP